VAVWTTPPTAEVTEAAGELAWVPSVAVAAAAGLSAGEVLAAGVLAGVTLGAGALGAEAPGAGVAAGGAEVPVPLTAACPAGGAAAAVAVAGETVEDTAEDVEDPAEDVADVTVDAADVTVDAVEDTVPPAAWAADRTTETAAGEAVTGNDGGGGAGAGDEGAPGSGGSCAADAGRAKITARIMASTKIAARAPQAHTQARRDQAPASLDNPTLWQMGTFPSTARQPRQTLRYRAINLTK
jgi:hypothetical protein